MGSSQQPLSQEWLEQFARINKLQAEWRDADKPESCPERDGLYMIRLSDGTEKSEFFSIIHGWATDEEVRWWKP